MSKPRILLDVDSSIWAAEEEYDKAALALYGRKFYEEDDPRDWYDEADLVERYGPDYRRIFSHALDPSTVSERELYPHVVSALRDVAEAYWLTFVTHHHAPATMRSALKYWLDRELALPFSLHVYTERVSKADKARVLRAGVIVDDKPQTIREAVDAGLYVATKKHPWTESIAQECPSVREFEDWDEFPSILRADGML